MDLQLYIYVTHIKHNLTQADMEKQVAICCWFCEKLDENPDFLCDLWSSDEAHFLLSGHVNSKNNIWGSTSPEDCLQWPLHSTKCITWLAISKHGTIGSYWFQDDSEWSLMVNSHWSWSTTLGRQRGFEKDGQWFQQGGVTPHTLSKILQWLRPRFGDCLFSQRSEIEWAPHLPDLNPPHFYPWGYFNDNVYEKNPLTIPELKRAITGRIRRISGKNVFELLTILRIVFMCVYNTLRLI